MFKRDVSRFISKNKSFILSPASILKTITDNTARKNKIALISASPTLFFSYHCFIEPKFSPPGPIAKTSKPTIGELFP